MVCKRVLCAAGCLTLLVFSAVAQQAPNPLSVQDCIRLAESAPSSITLARQDREIAGRQVVAARAGFLPQAGIIGGYTYNSPLRDDRSSMSYVALNGLREYATLFSVNQEIDTSGRLRADLRRAHAGRDAAAASLDIAQRDLHRAVTASYYRLLLARKLVGIVEESLAESRDFEKRTQQRFNGGEAARADVVKAQAQVASLNQILSTAQLDAESANHELASYWTTDVATRLEVVDVLDQAVPPPEAAPQPNAPFMRRPEIRLFDAQLGATRADVQTARSSLLPQLGVTFQYGLDANAVRSRERGYAAFVFLNVPLFDWMRGFANLGAAKTRRSQAEESRAIAERSFSREYQDALARVKSLYQQIGLADNESKLSQEDLHLSRVRYEGGDGAALDVVVAQNQLAQARTNYYTAIVDYLNARVDLEVASGR